MWIWIRVRGLWFQQGPKLIGTGDVGGALQGTAVALSADGNTLLVGGRGDNGGQGAAWVWTRTLGVWTQQGSKLVGTGAAGVSPQRGHSVALSADGNTALIGAPGDNPGPGLAAGAAWVWTRSAGVWTQQGNKLVGSGNVGSAQQGTSVALSADGNTALVGGYQDNTFVGAAWVFTRNAGIWTQEGSKLTANDATGQARQGWAVALSSDGNKALIGGPDDNGGVGAAWTWTRSGATWTQGATLKTTTSVSAKQGSAVGLSADGRRAVVGASWDGSHSGAVYVYDLPGQVWIEEASKRVGTGIIDAAEQGTTAAISADAQTIIVGGPIDNFNFGAAWVFVTGSTSDLNGDTYSDILWRQNSGALAAWFMFGTSIAASSGLGSVDPAWQIVGTRDFNGDGRADILWRHTSGAIAVWFITGAGITGAGLGVIDPAWTIVRTGDFNGDARADILWRHSSGALAVWLMNGTSVTAGGGFGVIASDWQVAGIDDFNGDRKSDILWRHTSGATAIWLLDGVQAIGGGVFATVDPAWQIAGTADLNGDHRADIIWRNSSGPVAIWFMNGTQIISGDQLTSPNLEWTIAAIADYSGDGRGDILWRHSSGAVTVWFMDGSQIIGGGPVATVDSTWQIVAPR